MTVATFGAATARLPIILVPHSPLVTEGTLTGAEWPEGASLEMWFDTGQKWPADVSTPGVARWEVSADDVDEVIQAGATEGRLWFIPAAGEPICWSHGKVTVRA